MSPTSSALLKPLPSRLDDQPQLTGSSLYPKKLNSSAGAERKSLFWTPIASQAQWRCFILLKSEKQPDQWGKHLCPSLWAEIEVSFSHMSRPYLPLRSGHCCPNHSEQWLLTLPGHYTQVRHGNTDPLHQTPWDVAQALVLQNAPRWLWSSPDQRSSNTGMFRKSPTHFDPDWKTHRLSIMVLPG